MNIKRISIEIPSGREIGARCLGEEWPAGRTSDGTPITVPLLDESGIDVLAECITDRVDHKRDCPILVTGDPGLGKSTVESKTCRRIDEDFPVDNVAFRLTDFEQIFNKNPHGDGEKRSYPQVVMDEAGHAMFGPEWLAREQRILAKQLIISRIKRQIVWFAAPKPKDVNHFLRNRSYIWIHIFEPKEYAQGYAMVRLAPPELQSEYYTQKFWVPKFAFAFIEDTGEWWNEYERRKVAFVNEVSSDIAHGNTGSNQTVEQRNFWLRSYVKLCNEIHNPLSARELADRFPDCGLKHAQISEILKASN